MVRLKSSSAGLSNILITKRSFIAEKLEMVIICYIRLPKVSSSLVPILLVALLGSFSRRCQGPPNSNETASYAG